MTEINPLFLGYQGTIDSAKTTSTPTENPYNIVKVETAEEIGETAKKEIGTMPFRVATAGYSAPPDGYEASTKEFLSMLKNELGARSTAFVTSPTADAGSIDAITTEVAGLNKGSIFYVTSENYVKYINPNNFPSTIDKSLYSKFPKYVLPNKEEYSKATAEASNVFLSTGGRDTTVNDFVNALKKGNKAIILDNKAINTPAWGEAKNRVENASHYLTGQINAFNEGKPLPYPEVGEFTLKFMQENKDKLNNLVKLVEMDGNDAQSIRMASRQAAKFVL